VNREKGDRVYEAWSENAWTPVDYVDATDKYMLVAEHRAAMAERDAEYERMRAKTDAQLRCEHEKVDSLVARVKELAREVKDEVRTRLDREREQRERLVETADGLLETLSQIDVVGPIGDIAEFEEARDDLADALAAARADDPERADT
jgi:hypothetical protein